MTSAPPARSVARGVRSVLSVPRAIAPLAALPCCLALTLATGCKKDKPELVRQPGIGDAMKNVIQPSVAPAASAPPASPERTTYDFERGIPTDPSALTAANPAPETAPADAGPEPEARDLASELSQALAGATGCADVVQVAAQPGGKLTISVTATVLATGTLSRVEARAPGQPASAVRCVEQLAAGIKLAPDVPNAPVRIQGSTDMQVKAVGGAGGTTGANPGAAPAPAPTNPNIAVSEKNADIARPEAPDFARPEPPDVAGPP
jgi:hypothetical protein